MADARDRKKSPEEMAKIMDELKRQKEIQKQRDDIKNLKNGQIIIFVMAGLVALGGIAGYYFNSGDDLEVVILNGMLAAIYLTLGFLYYKDPVVVPTVALTIYILVQILNMTGDPTTLAKGIILKIIIISGLIRAIKYGRDYKVAKVALESDPLDQGIFDDVK